MPRKKISVHTLVKNEARFMWFAVMSVIGYVDEIKITDTGSTDDTKRIIHKILDAPQAKGKVTYKEEPTDNFVEAKERLRMLEETDSDWIILVDADEIWWNDSIKKLVDFIQEKGDAYESVVVPTIFPVGDIFHYQESAAGRYKLAGKEGHYNLRAVNRRIPGLTSSSLPHGKWGFIDGDGHMIQERDPKKIAYLDAPYFHTSYLQRAGGEKDSDVFKRIQKRKHEIGIPFPKDYFYPEVFFRTRPEIVESPWESMTTSFKSQAIIETPLRKIKRRIWKGGVGY